MTQKNSSLHAIRRTALLFLLWSTAAAETVPPPPAQEKTTPPPPAAAAAEAAALQLSRFDALIRETAAEYGFDWRLIAAQIFHESRFNELAEAPDGGMGLLQLMPATAQEMNCPDPYDPAANLRAGVGYLARQRDRLPGELAERDRLAFALASYNGGYGHLLDARRLAAEIGKNPDIWFGHVEQAMTLLQQEDHYSRARHGFCRAESIVRYVRRILERYDRYCATPDGA